MAHNIGKMFYVGKVPWHGLGTALESPINMTSALTEGGLDYTVSLKPLTVQGEPSSNVPQRMAVVRDDVPHGESGRVLGVVHPQFRLLQNVEGAKLFDSLFGKGQNVYHTGGYLKHGEVVWLQARLPHPIEVAADDKLDTFLLFSNSHDGTYPIDIRITTIRVVCNNTLDIALADKSKSRVFRRGHSGSVELVKDAAIKFFESVLASQRAAQERMRHLSATKCDDEAFKRFLTKVLPIPSEPATAAQNSAVAGAYEKKRQRVLAARSQVTSVHYEGYVGPKLPSGRQPAASSTFWGALNSVTAWVDHVQPIKGDRFAHMIFGAGNDIKNRAFTEAVLAAG